METVTITLNEREALILRRMLESANIELRQRRDRQHSRKRYPQMWKDANALMDAEWATLQDKLHRSLTSQGVSL